MKITINTKNLLAAIQNVVGVVEKKQTMPILGHILFELSDDRLTLTATDLEVQIKSYATPVDSEDTNISFTVSGRKMYDILRSLDDETAKILLSDDKLTIKTNKSSYKLATLSTQDFPLFEDKKPQESFTINQKELITLFVKTQFAMAQQDVRFYLNGLLVEVGPNKLTAVATDGHRLAKATTSIEKGSIEDSAFILPRKAVQELTRTMNEDKECKVSYSANQAGFKYGDIEFTTKLIDGKFPDYKRVIPSSTETKIMLDVGTLKPALQRVSILANEKFKGVRVEIMDKELIVSSENPEQEAAKEVIDLNEEQKSLVLGFNVTYLIDAVSSCDGGLICLGLNDESSSALITDPSNPSTEYVVMPMRL